MSIVSGIRPMRAVTGLPALSLLVASLLLASLLVASGARAEPRKVVIGTEAAYPPFATITSEGELAGFDIDIARALCAAAGFDCTIVDHSFDGLIPGLLAGKFDALVASMAITDERRKQVDFTEKYYNSPGRFVARQDAGIAISPEGLAGRTACVQGATIHESYLRDVYPDTALKVYRTQQEAIMDLVAGRCDVLLGEGIVLARDLLETPEGAGFAYVGAPVSDPRWYGEGVGIAVRKGDTELREAFNRAIERIRADGAYATINDAYFPFDIYGE